jgi:tetratricopeptide (TPR) repeat protein
MLKKIALVFLYFLWLNFVLTAQNSISGDTISREIFGSIISKSGSKVKIKMDEVTQKLPKTNTIGELSKYFEKELLGALINGWLTIGEVKVTGIENSILTITIIKEKSVITIDGVKEDHFIAGQKVKFSWKELAASDESMFEKGMKVVDNDMNTAMSYFKQTIALNPKHAEAWNMIGMIYNENKIYDSAAYFYSKAYELDTSNIKYIKNIAVNNSFLNKYSESYLFSSKAVLHGPADAEAHYLRAMTYLYYLGGNVSEIQKKQILSDLDFAVSVDEKDSYYIKERMGIRSYFHDDKGACEDAKKYQSIEGSSGDDLVKQYCK